MSKQPQEYSFHVPRKVAGKTRVPGQGDFKLSDLQNHATQGQSAFIVENPAQSVPPVKKRALDQQTKSQPAPKKRAQDQQLAKSHPAQTKRARGQQPTLPSQSFRSFTFKGKTMIEDGNTLHGNVIALLPEKVQKEQKELQAKDALLRQKEKRRERQRRYRAKEQEIKKVKEEIMYLARIKRSYAQEQRLIELRTKLTELVKNAKSDKTADLDFKDDEYFPEYNSNQDLDYELLYNAPIETGNDLQSLPFDYDLSQTQALPLESGLNIPPAIGGEYDDSSDNNEVAGNFIPEALPSIDNLLSISQVSQTRPAPGIPDPSTSQYSSRTVMFKPVWASRTLNSSQPGMQAQDNQRPLTSSSSHYKTQADRNIETEVQAGWEFLGASAQQLPRTHGQVATSPLSDSAPLFSQKRRLIEQNTHLGSQRPASYDPRQFAPPAEVRALEEAQRRNTQEEGNHADRQIRSDLYHTWFNGY